MKNVFILKAWTWVLFVGTPSTPPSNSEWNAPKKKQALTLICREQSALRGDSVVLQIRWLLAILPGASQVLFSSSDSNDAGNTQIDIRIICLVDCYVGCDLVNYTHSLGSCVTL